MIRLERPVDEFHVEAVRQCQRPGEYHEAHQVTLNGLWIDGKYEPVTVPASDLEMKEVTVG